MNRQNLLWVFVYGTLKQGQPNFGSYCAGAVSITPAAVRGRLHEIPSGVPLFRRGTPILEVPGSDILAQGGPITPKHCALPQDLEPAPPAPPAPLSPGDWPLIQGELMAFADPVPRLAALDELEGFDPAGESIYQRVVLPLARPAGRRAWAYVLPPDQGGEGLTPLTGLSDWRM